MTNPEYRPTLVEYLKSNLIAQMGPLQPSIPGKKGYITKFRKDIADYFKKGIITEAEKNELEQMAQTEEAKLGNL